MDAPDRFVVLATRLHQRWEFIRRRSRSSVRRLPLGSDPTAITERRVAALYFVGVALLVLYPLLPPGYVLTLDMVFSPHANYTEFALRDKGPLYYGRLPFTLVLDALSLLVADWVLQKVILVALVAGSGLAMYVSVPARSPAAKLFAGTLFALNPFVYVRLLAGHWYFMLGYAALPLAVCAVYAALAPDNRTPNSRATSARWGAVGWSTVVAVFDPHAAVLLALALGPVVALRFVEAVDRRALATRLGWLGVVVTGLNAYWLLPALVSLADRSTELTVISSLDLVAFGARGTVDGNLPLSVAMLYGFWRGGDLLPIDVLPRWLVFAAFCLLLFLAVYGLSSHRDDPLAVGLAVAAMLAFLFALGVRSGVTAPVFGPLYEHVPVLRGMRDTQKFVGLLALSYAYLGGLGLDAILHEIRGEDTRQQGRLERRRSLGPSDRRTGTVDQRIVAVDRRTVAALVVVLVALSTPFAYSATAVGGFSGQLEPVAYPDEWDAVNDYLGDDSSSRVLFLPWHQYLDLSWTDRRVANPADIYFEKPVIRGQNIGFVGIESQAAAPAHRAVEAVLDDGAERTDVGAQLAPIGIEYVILATEADYRQYDYLDEQSDLTRVTENELLVVYRNDAFDEAPPATSWPPVTRPVPWTALLVGSVISILTALAGIGVRFRRG